MKNRVGLLGGTFNPVHLGHIDLGLKIKNAYKLDLIRYILSAKPPHKDNKTVMSSEMRWHMLEIVLDKKQGLVPCNIELKREKLSYTIDTVKELADAFPDEEHFFIIGSDSFLKIETWKKYIELLKIISFIVVLRDKIHMQKAVEILKKNKIKYDCSNSIREKSNVFDKKVFFYSYNSDKLSYSSTAIREKIRDGEEINDLVDPDVVNIIKGEKLYGCK